ncbi:hypothetical protein EYZ11_003086 [Aspergillus tanneri]|uniref:Uncharacterized protein n=1 Tax=Aspergillus tanneri TaxID=1220188 RepID=A0A4S3JRC2_9EURO|nr:hypothetical protein EYZ11_003086 [Aspergillus tanneri]
MSALDVSESTFLCQRILPLRYHATAHAIQDRPLSSGWTMYAPFSAGSDSKRSARAADGV